MLAFGWTTFYFMFCVVWSERYVWALDVAAFAGWEHASVIDARVRTLCGPSLLATLFQGAVASHWRQRQGYLQRLRRYQRHGRHLVVIQRCL